MGGKERGGEREKKGGREGERVIELRVGDRIASGWMEEGADGRREIKERREGREAKKIERENNRGEDLLSRPIFYSFLFSAFAQVEGFVVSVVVL